MDTVTFQKHFALVVCNELQSRFEDNHIMTTFKVLVPINMPSRQIGLGNYGAVDLELLYANMKLNAKLVRYK